MEQDLEQAFAYYRKGAEREDLNSLCRLARCYALGIGTRKDREKASALAQEILSRDWEESGELEDYGARAELEPCGRCGRNWSPKSRDARPAGRKEQRDPPAAGPFVCLF